MHVGPLYNEHYYNNTRQLTTGRVAIMVQVRMDGTNGKADLRMSVPENVGAFYRSSTKPDGTVLCLGRLPYH